MLDWKEAGPVMGVLVTMFGGLIGLFVASKIRRNETTGGMTAMTGVIGGALAERGKADALTEAVTGLTTAVTAADKRNRQEREDSAEEQARFRRNVIALLERGVAVMERRPAP